MSSNTITLKVPFFYEASIIAPRKRNSNTVFVKDHVDVEINTVDSAADLPVAFREVMATYNDEPPVSVDLVVFNDSLWSLSFVSRSVKSSPMHTTLEEVITNTQNNADMQQYGRSIDNPFVGFSCEPSSVAKTEIQYREWLNDTREEVIEQIKEKASSLLFAGGFLYEPCGEPRYVVNTFGLNNNHGGTALFLEQVYNSNISKSVYFRADQLAEAIKHAERTARNRGDTKSLPIKPHGTVEVLMPEMIRLPITSMPNIEFGSFREARNAVRNLCDVGVEEAKANIQAIHDKWAYRKQRFIDDGFYSGEDIPLSYFSEKDELTAENELQLGLFFAEKHLSSK